MDAGVRGPPGALAVLIVDTPREGPAPTRLRPTAAATARARTPQLATVQDLFVSVSVVTKLINSFISSVQPSRSSYFTHQAYFS